MSGYKLSFEGLKEKEGTIAIPLLVDKLQKLQNLNYLIGEYTEKRPFRAARMGAKKKSTISEYTLTVNSIEKGSTIIGFSPVSCQCSLFKEENKEYAPKGKVSLDMIHRYTGLIGEDNVEESLSKEIEDDGYRKKLANLFYELAPSENDTYRMRFENDNKVSYFLTKDTRSRLKNMIDISYSDDIERIYCPVINASSKSETDGMRSFNTVVDGKMLKVSVSSDLRDRIKEYLGRVVEMECECKVDDEGHIVRIVRVFNIEEKDQIILYELDYEGITYNFVKPLIVSIDSADSNDEGYWTLKNDDLRIYASGKEWNMAYQSFCSSFDFLVKEYVESDEPMTSKARKLGLKVKSYLRGC